MNDVNLMGCIFLMFQQQAQGGDQTAVSSAAAVTQRTQQIATITPPQVSAATLVAVTSGVTATQLATIGSVSSTATVLVRVEIMFFITETVAIS